jgi:hypothetical protein
MGKSWKIYEFHGLSCQKSSPAMAIHRFFAGKSPVKYDSMTPSHPIYDHRNVASRATMARFTGHERREF